MDVEIVKPKFVPVENGKEDQSKGNGPVAGLTEPITFGSHGLEEAVNGPETHLPKDVVDDWSAASEQRQMQVHRIYFVRCRLYADPKLKPKFDAAEKDVQNKKQARILILDKLLPLKAKRTQLSDQIGPLSKENERFKLILDEKKKEMEPMNKLLNELRPNKANREKGAAPICSSEEELNRTIKSLEYRIQHESIPLTEEKKILREIKQLEGTRVQIIGNAKERAKIEKESGSKSDLEDQFKQMGDGFSGVKKERQVVTTQLKQLLDEKKELNKEIKKLEEELDAATEKTNKSKDAVKELKIKHNEANACVSQYLATLDKANILAFNKDLSALQEFSNSELEKFMKMWNESKSFRDDYEKRILPSLDYRQLSRDGRMRGQDEKPLVVPEPSTLSKPDQITVLKPKQTKQDSAPTLQNGVVPTEKSEKEGKTKMVKEVKSKGLECIDDDEKEKITEVENPKKVENKVDEAKLKEIRREAEIVKAKQALERKKKKAEKDAAKAAIKAQKEAEKKEKDREKKLKKKASASGLVPEPEEQPTEAEVLEPEKTEETIEEPVISKSKGRKDGAMRNRTRSKGPDKISKVMLKRKKSTNYWVWAAPAAVSIMMVLVIGYKYLI